MSPSVKENSRKIVIFRNMVRWARRVSYLARGATKWRQWLSILLVQELRRTFGRGVRPMPAAVAGPSANWPKNLLYYLEEKPGRPLSDYTIHRAPPHTHIQRLLSQYYVTTYYIYLVPTCLIKHAQDQNHTLSIGLQVVVHSILFMGAFFSRQTF